MEDYVIAIPSYARAELIKNYTLSVFDKCNIPNDKITIFVANQEEYDTYKSKLGDKYKIVIGVIGLENQRNFISNYYDEGQNIFFCDDDIQRLAFKDEDAPRKLKDFDNLNEFLLKAFKITKDNNTILFGVYPVDSSLFMKYETTCHLTYIVGACYGMINDKSIILENANKEDFERTLKVYDKYGKVIRFNNVCIKTKYYTNKGGMQSYGRTLEDNNNRVEYLVSQYPKYAKILKKKNSEYLEIKLISKKQLVPSTKDKLLEYLKTFKFPKNRDRINISGVEKVVNNRKVGNPVSSITLGLVKPRHLRKDQAYISKLSQQHPILYQLCQDYIKELNPEFHYTSITLNKNLVCKEHRDSNNKSLSLIIGIGDYEGGNLYIEGVKHNIKDNPVIFNGNNLHYNDEITYGDKYSLVYYCS